MRENSGKMHEECVYEPKHPGYNIVNFIRI